MNYQTQMKIKRYLRQPVVTYAFLGLQIVLFILMTFDGGSTNTFTLIEYGAKFNPLLVAGQWWRLVTPIFLHIGWMHLLMNSVILYFLGTQLEDTLGHWRFALVYLVSGIAGNAASFAFNATAVSAGASTSLFGLFGVTIFLGRTYTNNPAIQQMSRNFGTLIVLNLVFGFFSTSVDLAGHLGGLVGGFLISTAISVQNPLPRWKKKRLLYGAIYAGLLAALLVIGYVRTIGMF